jgi:hypothetical protein
MDGLCCLGCGRAAAYEFKNLETGYQGVMCTEHAKALDVRDPAKFLGLPAANDEATTRLKQEISDAYSHHKLEGHRIPERTIETDSRGSLASVRHMEQMAQQHEQVLARRWDQTIGPDPWLRPPPPPPPPPEPPGYSY